MSFVGQQSISVGRLSAGSRGADGRWVEGTTTVSAIKATVNPITGEELLALPEGERSGEQIKIITKFELRMTDETLQQDGDIIKWEGKHFRVVNIRRYRKVIPHIEARAVRVRDSDLGSF